MKLWRNVLVHVDDRPAATHALEKSVLVAQAFGGHVLAFDAVEPIAPALPFHLRAPGVDHELAASAAARAEQLRETIANLRRRVPIAALVGEGRPGRALLRCAALRETDLIIKAASGADVRRMNACGTTALHLLRGSEVPVWLYAPPARRSGRVVAAVGLPSRRLDGEHLDQQVVLAAARLSGLEDAELHVVCVADRARDRLYENILSAAEYRRYLAKDRAVLRRSLVNLTTLLGPRSVPHLVEGDALEVLAKTVVELDADTLTVGRAYTGARAGMSGSSFAERLFTRVGSSVLLVPQVATDSPFALAGKADSKASFVPQACSSSNPS